MEIIEYSSPDETTVCNLTSLMLPTYILNGMYDFNKLYTITKTITYNLNCMINVYYPISKAHQSNFHHLPSASGSKDWWIHLWPSTICIAQ